MPSEKEHEAEKRGGVERWRSLKLPSGRVLHLAVTPEAGPRGGHTLAMAEGGVLTRQTFVMIANVIYELDGINDDTRFKIANAFADKLAATNPRFDRERFLTAATAGPPDTHYRKD